MALQPPPYQSAQGSTQWSEWYRVINEILDGVNTSINNITDVTITSVADNDLLAWDSGSSLWINQTPAEANLQSPGDILDDLNTLGAVVNDGEFLVGTGAGVFAWESGATARTSLGLVAGGAGDIWVEKAGDLMTGPLGIGHVTGDTGESATLYVYTAVTTAVSRPIRVETKLDSPTAFGPTIELYRNITTPAIDDFIGDIRFTAKDSAGTNKTYCSLQVITEDPSTAAGKGMAKIRLNSLANGTQRTRYEINDTEHVWFQKSAQSRLAMGNGLYTTGTTGGDKGTDTINTTTYYVGGIAGADFGPSSVSSITVVKGIVTAIS